MKHFRANTAKQLDICLRMLYAERVYFHVNVVETSKGKIVYEIDVKATDEQLAALQERYRILIS